MYRMIVMDTKCKFPGCSRDDAFNKGCRCKRCIQTYVNNSTSNSIINKEKEIDTEEILKIKYKCKYPSRFHSFPKTICNCTECVKARNELYSINRKKLYPFCFFPNNKALKSYKKGCRCKRCISANKQKNHLNNNQDPVFKQLQQNKIDKERVELGSIYCNYDSNNPHKITKKTIQLDYEYNGFGKFRKKNKPLQERIYPRSGRQRGLEIPTSLEKRTLDYAIKTRLTARKRASELKLLPSLSLQEQYEELEIYKKCYMLSESTNIPHEVDHIIPLSKGGLHHPSNLQVLTAEENRKKSNKII